jgi:hypothetical protein
MSNDTNPTSNAKRPTHRIYSVMRKGEEAKWTEIGAAWPHKDGQGFNLKFNAMPTGNADVVIRTITAKKWGAQ